MNDHSNLKFGRKQFVTDVVSGLAAINLASSATNLFPPRSRFKAIGFDAFVIFDPRTVIDAVIKVFPEKGKELVETWRTKQFEYCWLRTAGGKYKDFWEVTEDALAFAANSVGVSLTVVEKAMLMDPFKALRMWPDVLPLLKQLKADGIKLAFLSNMTVDMLRSSANNAGIDTYFDYFISTDEVKMYKPAAAAYQLGLQRFNMKKEDILFAAFAGWDAAGAKWFGYPTFWVNRQNKVAEELDITVDASGKDLEGLVKFLYGNSPG